MEKIRYLQKQDQEFWRQLDKHLPETEFQKKVRDKQAYVFLKDDRPVGIFRYNLFWDNTPFLNMIYVLETYQNQGYGTKLLQVLELTLLSQGIQEYIVYVSQFISSNQFFLKRHAKKVSEEPISIHGKDYIENEYVVKVGDVSCIRASTTTSLSSSVLTESATSSAEAKTPKHKHICAATNFLKSITILPNFTSKTVQI